MPDVRDVTGSEPAITASRPTWLRILIGALGLSVAACFPVSHSVTSPETSRAAPSPAVAVNCESRADPAERPRSPPSPGPAPPSRPAAVPRAAGPIYAPVTVVTAPAPEDHGAVPAAPGCCACACACPPVEHGPPAGPEAREAATDLKVKLGEFELSVNSRNAWVLGTAILVILVLVGLLVRKALEEREQGAGRGTRIATLLTILFLLAVAVALAYLLRSNSRDVQALSQSAGVALDDLGHAAGSAAGAAPADLPARVAGLQQRLRALEDAAESVPRERARAEAMRGPGWLCLVLAVLSAAAAAAVAIGVRRPSVTALAVGPATRDSESTAGGALGPPVLSKSGRQLQARYGLEFALRHFSAELHRRRSGSQTPSGANEPPIDCTELLAALATLRWCLEGTDPAPLWTRRPFARRVTWSAPQSLRQALENGADQLLATITARPYDAKAGPQRVLQELDALLANIFAASEPSDDREP